MEGGEDLGGRSAEGSREIAPITLSSHRLPPPPLPFAAAGSGIKESHAVTPVPTSRGGEDINEALEQLEWIHPPSLCVSKRQRYQAEFHEKNMNQLLGCVLPLRVSSLPNFTSPSAWRPLIFLLLQLSFPSSLALPRPLLSRL